MSQAGATAVTPPELRHQVVLASAGTGKTYRLVVRYVALLARGVRPSAILATTFTRKAASEIQGRVLGRLAEAARDEAAAARLADEIERPELGRSDFQALLGEVCRELHALQIGTLDSFFHRLVSVMRWELGAFVAPQLAPLEDPAVALLRERGIDDALAVLAEEDFAELVELISRLYRGDAQRSVAWGMDRVLVELYELFRECPTPDTWSGPHTALRQLSEEELESVLSSLARAAPGLPKALMRGVAETVARGEARRWEELLEKGPSATVSQGREQYRRAAVEGELRDELETLVHHAQAALLERLREQGVATRRILGHFEDAFRGRLQRQGVLLFGDLAHLLARDVPELSPERRLDLHFRLDARIQHLLLDEFQDTSRVQWQGLHDMAEEILAHADGSHTFFCVGDPKQAIYGWRGGCSDLFVDLEAELLARGEPPRTLDASYRSSQVLLDVVNQVFGHLPLNAALGAQQELAVRWSDGFRPHESALAPDRAQLGYVALRSSPEWEGEFPAEDLWAEAFGLQTAEDPDQERPKSHLDAAAAQVRDLHRQMPGASIGVLVSTNRTVREVLDRLRERGVVASGEGGSAIDDDPAVTASLAALRLSEHPQDLASWVHVLAVPWASAALGDLSAGAEWVSRKLRRELFRAGLPRVLAQWLDAAQPWLPERSRRRMRQLVTLAERFAADVPEARLDDFVDWIPRLTVVEPEPSSVRVMTVHKAKGLEFDVVVLCELDRRLGALSNPQVNVLRERPVEPPAAIFRATNKWVRSGSEILQRAHQQELDRRLWDDLSSLYVAMTRARHGLVMLVQPVRMNKSGPAREAATGAGVLRQALAQVPDRTELTRGDQVLYESGRLGELVEAFADVERTGSADAEPASTVDPSANVADRRARSRRMRLVRPSLLHARARRPLAHDLVGLDAQQDRKRGSFIHRLLTDVSFVKDTSPAWSRRKVRAAARAEGLGEREAEAALQELLRAFEVPEIRRVFERPTGASELWRERHFAVPLDRDLVRGVFDRVVLHLRRGEVTSAQLVELKTGVAGDLDDWRPQVESYREALSAMIGLLPTSIEAQVVAIDQRAVWSV